VFKYFLFVVISLALITACSSVSVTNDYDPAVDFSTYKTFSIYDKPIKDSELEKVPLAKKRVLEAITNEMQKKGLTLAESALADLTIYAHAGTTDKMNVTDYGYGYGGWWGPYPYGRNIDVSYYTEASLIIDFADNAKKELVWRGIGTAALQDRGTPEERQKFIDEAVAKILEQYPPQK
jgi:hypothetical protein